MAQNIKFKKFRANACRHQKETVAYLGSMPDDIKYFIRADMNTGLSLAL